MLWIAARWIVTLVPDQESADEWSIEFPVTDPVGTHALAVEVPLSIIELIATPLPFPAALRCDLDLTPDVALSGAKPTWAVGLDFKLGAAMSAGSWFSSGWRFHPLLSRQESPGRPGLIGVRFRPSERH